MLSPRARLWLDRFLRLVASAGATIVAAVAGIVRNKWLAMHLDTTGIGVLAQVISAQTWLGTASGLGMSLPIARALGDASGRGDDAAARKTLWTALTLVSFTTLAVSTLGIVFAGAISTALLGSAEHADLVRISMVGVAGIALGGALLGVFAGRSDLKGPLAFAIAGGGVATAITLLVVPQWGLRGAVFGSAIFFPAALAGALFTRRRAHTDLVVPRPHPAYDSREARSLLRVASAALFLSLLDLGTLLALRAHYLREYGVASNGLLQAAIALSQLIGAIFYAYLGNYAFGKVSAAAGVGGAPAVQLYTRRQWMALVVLAAVVIGFAMIAATPMLHVLYSSRFDAARPMMACALFGEFGRICSQSLALGALPLAGAPVWFSIGVTQPIALGLGYLLFSRLGAGPLSLPLAYALGGMISWGSATVLMGRNRMWIGTRNLALAGACAVALLALAVWIVGPF